MESGKQWWQWKYRQAGGCLDGIGEGDGGATETGEVVFGGNSEGDLKGELGAGGG